MHEKRIDRVAEQLRAELAELIENELADPRVGAITVTAVHLSGDGKLARVNVSPLPSSSGDPRTEKSDAAILKGLDHARGFLRHELAARLPLRFIPDLRFVIDHGPQHAQRVETLLQRIKKRTPLTLLLLATAGVGLLYGAPASPSRTEMLRYEDSIEAMGSTFTIAAYGASRDQLSAGVTAALQESRRLDAILSNYKSESELSKVNREASLGPVQVSSELFDLLEKCRSYSEASDGAFDWTVGPLMRTWGFFRGSGRLPDRSAVQAALRSVGYKHVYLDKKSRSVHFDRAGIELDPGGIGKGYAVDKMVEVLRNAGIRIALVNAGGSSIFGLGAPQDETGWHIRISDPKSGGLAVAEVDLKNQSLSTSGASEKFFKAGGTTYSHIMDPRTGYPAQGTLSVSVITPMTIDSEAWTKPVFVNGPAWAKAHLPSGFRAFLCDDNGKPCYWLR
jgi:thiamine biosynthesis lipoprotein